MNSAESDTKTNLPILAHLEELRRRVFYALISIVITTTAAFFFAEKLLNILTDPYCRYLNNLSGECTQKLLVLTPTENLEIYFQISLTAGAILAMPWILLQLWLFIAPGLHHHERKYVYFFVPATTLLFISGVIFTWYVLIPPGIYFLGTFLTSSVESRWQLAPYIEFVTSFLFWLGVSFEMPLIFYFLSRFGIVSGQLLREKWRFSIVGIAILAAVITPSVDPVTMILAMLPLILLYGLSIILAEVGYRQSKR